MPCSSSSHIVFSYLADLAAGNSSVLLVPFNSTENVLRAGLTYKTGLTSQICLFLIFVALYLQFCSLIVIHLVSGHGIQ